MNYRHYSRQLLLGLLMLTLPLQVHAQSNVADSLANLLAETKVLMQTDQAEALSLALGGLDRAEEYELLTQAGAFQTLVAQICQQEGNYQEADQFFSQAIETYLSEQDTAREASVLLQRGYSYLFIPDFNRSLVDFSRAMLLYQRCRSMSDAERQKGIITTHSNLFNLYISAHDEARAQFHEDTLSQLMKTVTDTTLLARFSTTQGRFDIERQDYPAALQHFQSSISLYELLEDTEQIKGLWFRISTVYSLMADQIQREDPDLSKSYLDLSRDFLLRYLDYCQQTANTRGELFARRNLSADLYLRGDFEGAKRELYRALYLSGQVDAKEDSALIIWRLHELHQEAGELDSAIHYLYLYDDVSYNYRNVEQQKAQRFAEALYETEKKELEKQRIKAEAREKLRNTLWIAALVALLLLGGILYFYQRQKAQKQLNAKQKELNQQIVLDLMKEQAIETLNARLEGQEKERDRIAGELHDRLGGTLSAAKLTLEGLEKKLSDPLRPQYQQAHKLLHLASQETRQISHDMKALPVQQLGLEDAIRQLANTLSLTGKIKVVFHTVNRQQIRLEPVEERNLYRIIQELLQNVIKHAQASRVDIQLIGQEKGFLLMLEDNGRGFHYDPENLLNGMGLGNVSARAHQLGGSMEIDSQPGRGTTIMIEKK